MRAVLIAMAALLSACGGGGGGDGAVQAGCVGSFLGGSSSQVELGACTACGGPDDSDKRAFDGNAASAATWYTLGGALTMGVRAPAGKVFEAGNFAGALMEIPATYAAGDWTFATFLDDVPMEVRTPANASGEDPNVPAAGAAYYGFATSLPFDQVQIRFIGSGAGESVAIHEFCGTM